MDQYFNLDHTEYKALEEAMTAFKETVHTSVEGFYHKSIRVPIGKTSTLEFTGPAVKAPPVEKEGPLDRRKRERRSLSTRKAGGMRKAACDRRQTTWIYKREPERVDRRKGKRRIYEDPEDRHYRRKGPFRFDRRKKAVKVPDTWM